MDRFLPGVPARRVERMFAAAPGREIDSGKFDSPESSAALAANTFGYFIEQANTLPPLPGLENAEWPARCLELEKTVRFPWRGGRHPVLDVLVATRAALIGVESKRFEPFRGKIAAKFSGTYWRSVWGGRMKGYEGVRNKLRQTPKLFRFLNAAQLVKHAFALRTAVNRPGGRYRGLSPILFYVYAEPAFRPKTGKPVDDAKKAAHRNEIARFAKAVEGDEVAFSACSYGRLLADWSRDSVVRAHAEAVRSRFSP